MEKIYYNELWNHKVISSTYVPAIISMTVLALMLIFTSMAGILVGGIFILVPIFILICILLSGLIMIKRFSETTEIKKIVNFYNSCITNNECTEIDDELRYKYINMSKNIILNRLQIVWRPEFIYDDETKVYKVENTQVIIVNGYFKDNSISRLPKRNYRIVFIGNEYYMCYIDNVICWQKENYWARFYKERALKNIKVDYLGW